MRARAWEPVVPTQHRVCQSDKTRFVSQLNDGFRADLVVEGKVIVEIRGTRQKVRNCALFLRLNEARKYLQLQTFIGRRYTTIIVY